VKCITALTAEGHGSAIGWEPNTAVLTNFQVYC